MHAGSYFPTPPPQPLSLLQLVSIVGDQRLGCHQSANVRWQFVVLWQFVGPAARCPPQGASSLTSSLTSAAVVCTARCMLGWGYRVGLGLGLGRLVRPGGQHRQVHS